MSFSATLKRLGKPLASRKVRVALTTVIAAYAAEYGLGVSEQMIYTILGVGTAIILGIAHEDAGKGPAAPADDAKPFYDTLHAAATQDRWNQAADVNSTVDQLKREG